MNCSHEHTHEGAARTLSVLGEKWTIQLLHQIVQGSTRFGQLQRAMPGISPKTLMVRLRELEEAGILTRNVLPGYPLHVEYAATERGKALSNVIRAMDDWGERAEERPAQEQATFRECEEHERAQTVYRRAPPARPA
jgi:DNA-binding HxlR family transcriptional regulator